MTFNEEVLDAVKDIVKQFKFSGGDAVASKARSVANLLDAFNEGDFLKVADMSSELLKTDCERLFKGMRLISLLVVSRLIKKKKVTSISHFLSAFGGVP